MQFFIKTLVGSLATILLATNVAQAAAPCAIPTRPAESSFMFYVPDVPIRNQLATEEVLSDPENVFFLQGQILGNDCNPITGAEVEIWYAGTPDSAGNYYLQDYRGRQRVDECGSYKFTQSFPVQFVGSPHVHVRVSKNNTELIVTKVYFEESLAVYFVPDPSIVSQVTNEADGSRSAVFNIYLDMSGTETLGCDVRDGDSTSAIDGDATIGIDVVFSTHSPTAPVPQTTSPVTPVPTSPVLATPSPATATPLTLSPEAPIPEATTDPVTRSPAPQVSGNNNCYLASTALPITVKGGRESFDTEVVTVHGSNEGGDIFQGDRCFGVKASSPGVWYKVQGTGGLMAASTCHPGTNLDTKLTVHEGVSCAALQCVTANDDSSTSSTQCPTNSLASRTEWESNLGTTYYIMVHAFASKVGNYELSIESYHTNDQCVHATPLTVGETITASTVDAAIPFENNIARCQNDGGVVGSNAGLWYSTIGTGNRMQASTCNEGTKIPNKLYLFEKTCADNDEYRYEGDDDWDPDRRLQNFYVDISPDPLEFLTHCIGGVHNANGSPSSCVSYQWNSIAGEQYYVLVTSSIYEGDIAVTLTEV